MKRVALVPVIIGGLLIAGCVGGAPAPAAPTVVPTASRGGAAPAATTAPSAAGTGAPSAGSGAGDPAKGKELVTAKGCIACHTIQGVPGAVGTIGPELTKVASKATFVPDVNLAFNDDNLKKWLSNPPGVKPATQMPNLGLSADEINNLVAYLKTLK